MSDPRIAELTEQFKGIAGDLTKRLNETGKDVSPDTALLALIASLLFVLIDTVESKKS